VPEKKNMSIIEESIPGDLGSELFRTNYFECFPIIYRFFTGFGQPEKAKFRIVIAYGFAELG
jgi:hypothetical protein